MTNAADGKQLVPFEFSRLFQIWIWISMEICGYRRPFHIRYALLKRVGGRGNWRIIQMAVPPACLV